MEKYISGLFVFAPTTKSPSFVKGKLSIKPKEFIKWLQENERKINDKGFMSIDILESKDGKRYCKLNTYNADLSTGKTLDEWSKGKEIKEEEIPF